MKPVIETPWRHESELAMVRDMLYPQHVIDDLYAPVHVKPDMRAQAVNMITGWSTKAGVPRPLSSTAELAAARLFDEEAQSSLLASAPDTTLTSNLAGNLAVRSTYATAFCRFVNGLVDKDVAKAGESSMFANAREIGLPIPYVEFRHRATHGRELPNSIELRYMADEALKWLYDNWWKVNATGDPGRALWEMEEHKRELQEARRFREDRDERRELLYKQDVEAVNGSGERPTRYLCKGDGGACQDSFLLVEDLSSHQRIWH